MSKTLSQNVIFTLKKWKQNDQNLDNNCDINKNDCILLSTQVFSFKLMKIKYFIQKNKKF